MAERIIHSIQGNEIEEYISREEIKETVVGLAKEIQNDYEGQEVLFVVILKGASTFAADLQREIDPDRVDMTIDYMRIKSYGDKESSRAPQIVMDLATNIENLNVIVVEDIFDTGYSLNKLLEILKQRNPKSLKTCVLLSKPDRREVEGIVIDYLGRPIENKFVVGYGLDFNERFRALPYVGVIIDDAKSSKE